MLHRLSVVALYCTRRGVASNTTLATTATTTTATTTIIASVTISAAVELAFATSEPLSTRPSLQLQQQTTLHVVERRTLLTHSIVRAELSSGPHTAAHREEVSGDKQAASALRRSCGPALAGWLAGWLAD